MPRAYFLGVWANPPPAQPISALEVRPLGPRFVIAGVTLGHLDEHPFVRDGARELKIVLPRPEDAVRTSALEVEVDRGVVGYPQALPLASAEEFLGDAFRGWGETQNPRASPAYVRVAATPS